MLTSVPTFTADRGSISPPTGGGRTRRQIDDMEMRLRGLADSSEPAIVFSSLIRLCVPTFNDACSVDIVEGGRVRYRIDYPRDSSCAASAARADGRSVATTFASDLPGWPSYTGVMTSFWHDRRPTAQDAERAASIVDNAIRMIRRERLADPVRTGLAFALATTQRHMEHRSR